MTIFVGMCYNFNILKNCILNSIKGTILMLEKGHIFVYGGSGVCRVEDISVCDYGAGKKEYYILQPVFDPRSSLSIPVDSPAFSARASELLTKEEVDEIISIFPELKTEWVVNDKVRVDVFRKLLEGGTRKDIASLINAIQLHKIEIAEKGKKLRSMDESLLIRAEKLLYGEFAWVLGIDIKEVPEYIKNNAK